MRSPSPSRSLNSLDSAPSARSLTSRSSYPPFAGVYVTEPGQETYQAVTDALEVREESGWRRLMKLLTLFPRSVCFVRVGWLPRELTVLLCDPLG